MTRVASGVEHGANLARPVAASERDGPRQAAVMGGNVVDYDVHGMMGIRLENPAPEDVRAFERHLRGFRRPLAGEPDLVVRYVDRLTTSDIGCVDVERSGFDNEGFLLRDGVRSSWVRIPFDRLGAPCSLVAERGMGAIPHFKAMLRLVALHRGYVPVHGSAFVHENSGVLVAGWTHGGKTSASLAFAENGAQFVGDDLVLLTPDGERMFGLSTPLSVSWAQLSQSPRLRMHVGHGRLQALGCLDWLDRTEERLAPDWPRSAGAVGVLRRAARPMRRRLAVRMSPEQAFWNGARHTARPRTLFLAMSHRRSELMIEQVDPAGVADRMMHSMRFEDLGLTGDYAAFRYAYPEPERANELIEQAHEMAGARLRQALAGMDAFLVRHPYPPSLQSLYDAMAPLCKGSVMVNHEGD